MTQERSRWDRWHDAYGDPASYHAKRLAAVQRRIRDALDAAPPGPIRVISACAGQGRDVIGALEGHPRRGDVEALLVELDDHNVEEASRRAAAAGVDGLRVEQADAANTATYRDAVPADLLLLCGIFGNVTDDDVQVTARNASRLCAPGATVIWTRHRHPPDLTSAIRRWFAEAGFTEVGLDSPGEDSYAVGTCRLTGPPLPFRDDLHLFTFMDER